MTEETVTIPKKILVEVVKVLRSVKTELERLSE